MGHRAPIVRLRASSACCFRIRPIPALLSPDGESAVDWARKFNNPTVLTDLKLLPAAASAPSMPSPSPGRSSAMEAVARSLPIQRTASATVMTSGGCAGLSRAAAHDDGDRGGPHSVAVAFVGCYESAQSPILLNGIDPQMLQLVEGGGTPDSLVYVTMAMAAQRMPPSRATDAFVRYLAAKQRAAGNWKGVGGTRAPMQDGDFSRTAMAIRALTVYATPARAREYQASVIRAAAWLVEADPADDRGPGDAVAWTALGGRARRCEADAHSRVVASFNVKTEAGRRRRISPAMPTPRARFSIRCASLACLPRTPAMQRGVTFLLRTQHDDGSWFVKSRAMKVQPYFESGFPYGHDQWISHAGTAWAAMGLASAALDEPAAADPFIGTFTMNAAKSKMSGAPAVVEGTLIITEDGDSLVITPSFRTTDGPVRAARLVVPKAGGIVRAPEGQVAYDSSIVTRVNPNTIQVVTTRQGQEGVRVQLTLSPDGKTLRRSIKGTNPQGQPFEGLSVLERQ